MKTALFPFIFLLWISPQTIQGQIIKDFHKISIQASTKEEFHEKLKSYKHQKPSVTKIEDLEDEFIVLRIETRVTNDWGFGDEPQLPTGFEVYIKRSNEKEYQMFEHGNQLKVYASHIKDYDYSEPASKEKLYEALDQCLLEVLEDFSSWGYERWPESEQMISKEKGHRLSIHNIWLKSLD
ncbi:MAG: hypothetical protein AAGD28_23100 [Bacteroidota bacterium]